MKHNFELKAVWRGGLAGKGNLKAKGLEAAFSIPSELRGPGEGTNPEELLLAASSSCFLITLGVSLNLQGVPVQEVILESHLQMEMENGFTVKSIEHSPLVRIDGEITPELIRTVDSAVRRAEEHCLIAKALRGNVVLKISGPAVERAR